MKSKLLVACIAIVSALTSGSAIASPRLIGEGRFCSSYSSDMAPNIQALKASYCTRQIEVEARLTTAVLRLYGRIPADEYTEFSRRAVDAMINARQSIETTVRNAELAEVNRQNHATSDRY